MEAEPILFSNVNDWRFNTIEDGHGSAVNEDGTRFAYVVNTNSYTRIRILKRNNSL